jgi:hypothetical protein
MRKTITGRKRLKKTYRKNKSVKRLGGGGELDRKLDAAFHKLKSGIYEIPVYIALGIDAPNNEIDLTKINITVEAVEGSTKFFMVDFLNSKAAEASLKESAKRGATVAAAAAAAAAAAKERVGDDAILDQSVVGNMFKMFKIDGMKGSNAYDNITNFVENIFARIYAPSTYKNFYLGQNRYKFAYKFFEYLNNQNQCSVSAPAPENEDLELGGSSSL